MKIPGRSLLFVGMVGILAGCVASILHKHYAEEASRAYSAALSKGASRSDVMQALGTPCATRVEDGRKIDDFLLPNQTWNEGSSGPNLGSTPTQIGDPGGAAALLFIALGIEVVVDPVMTCIYLFQGRDATKCKYEITYGKDDRVERIDLTYPQGFGPGACPGR